MTFFTVIGLFVVGFIVMKIMRALFDKPANLPQNTQPMPEPIVFSNRFTEIEKEAIIISLFILALSDDEFHENERKSLGTTAALLDYRINIDRLEHLLTTEPPAKTIKVLADLSESNKNWYIMCALEMINADGKVTKSEIDTIDGLFTAMDITAERALYTAKKMTAMKRHFNF